jgi:hypothetical protein
LQGARDEVNSIRNLAVEEIKNRGAQSPAGKQAQDEGLTPGTPEFNRRVGEIAQTGIDARLAQLNATIAQTEATMAGMTRAQSQEARATAAEERAERKDLRAADTETERLALERRRVEAQEAANRRREEESRRLTPKEVDLKTETENVISAADSGMRMLRRAYELNPNTFDTSLPDTLQRKALEAAGSKDPKLLRTRELENILGQQAITQLKTAFGGNPTEGERKILLDLQGLGAKSVQERSAILRNAFSALRSRREREQRRLSDITAGRYRETTPEPAGGE